MAEPIDTQTPPQAVPDFTESVFNFSNGDLGKVKRIVQRQQLKTRIKFLQTVIQTHQPLIKAMQVTTKAFQEGVKEGLRQAFDAEKESKVDILVKPVQTESDQVAKEVVEQIVTKKEQTTHKQANDQHAELPRASVDLQKVLNP